MPNSLSCCLRFKGHLGIRVSATLTSKLMHMPHSGYSQCCCGCCICIKLSSFLLFAMSSAAHFLASIPCFQQCCRLGAFCASLLLFCSEFCQGDPSLLCPWWCLCPKSLLLLLCPLPCLCCALYCACYCAHNAGLSFAMLVLLLTSGSKQACLVNCLVLYRSRLLKPKPESLNKAQGSVSLSDIHKSPAHSL